MTLRRCNNELVALFAAGFSRSFICCAIAFGVPLYAGALYNRLLTPRGEYVER